MEVKPLNKLLGNIDIYLLDQILKNRFNKSMRILDAGCGEGRNLIYFLNQGYNVYGLDNNPDAIRMLQFVSRSVAPNFPQTQFMTADLEAIPFEDKYFDWVISSAVLHFAKDQANFEVMFSQLCRVLKKGGTLFVRMTSNRGLENEVVALDNGQYQLPDGSLRFLLDQTMLDQLIQQYQLTYLEPIKYVVVENQRTMATLVLRKV